MPKYDFNKVATHIHDCTDMNMIHHINFLTSYKISNEAKSQKKQTRSHQSSNVHKQAKTILWFLNMPVLPRPPLYSN